MPSRRAFLALMSARPLLSAAGKGQESPGDMKRFLDAATEFEVVRMTGTDYESILPSNTGRAVSRRAEFFLCASNRGQGMQAYRIDVKTGKTRQLTELAALEPETMTLAGNDRWLYAIDGVRLLQIPRAASTPSTPKTPATGPAFAASPPASPCPSPWPNSPARSPKSASGPGAPDSSTSTTTFSPSPVSTAAKTAN